MARLARAEVFDPSEVAALHLCARVVRRCKKKKGQAQRLDSRFWVVKIWRLIRS